LGEDFKEGCKSGHDTEPKGVSQGGRKESNGQKAYLRKKGTSFTARKGNANGQGRKFKVNSSRGRGEGRFGPSRKWTGTNIGIGAPKAV